MSVSENLIDFDIIENQKENIQSLPSGRSAKALAAVFSSGPGAKSPSPGLNDTKTLNDAIRQEYEIELQSIGESDDPLDIYDRYVKWTLDAYPSAQATPQSGLLPLLERATKAFLSSSDYKNDPRYLRLWLHYIRLFSDAPREVFAFLARHNIGENLALFYEEFASWLEGVGRFAQAEEVYKLGLQREARPAERLLRKFGEFQKRLEQRPRSSDGPSSPALPKVRPALAAKIDPFASASAATSDPQAQQSRGGGSGAQPTRSRKPKMAIFSDADNAEANKPTSSSETKGWESIGSLHDRKKENTIEAKPWVGETLKSGKRAGTVQKMAVYKDETLSRVSEPIMPSKNVIPQNEKETINARTGRVERVFVDLEAIYPDRHNPGHEMSLEELRASSRGWLNRDWSKQRKEVFKDISGNVRCKEPSAKQQQPADDVGKSLSKHLHDKLVIDEKQQVLDDRSEGAEAHRDNKSGKSKRLKVREIRGETQTIKTNLESPTGPKIRRKNSSEPTMTFHTRAATDEIYDLFNQPLKSETRGADNADSLYGSDYDEDDYTSAGESTATGRVSGTASEFGEDETTTFRKSAGGVQDDNYGDETRAESLLGVSEWTEFTNRDVPQFSADGQIQHNHHTGDKHNLNNADDPASHHDIDGHSEYLSTPSTSHLKEGKMLHRFVPVPPEDYNPLSGPYRDAAIVAQNRLPFMTPIVEQTESSLSSTVFKEKKHLHTKTPSKRVKPLISDTPTIPEVEDLLLSSPFQDYTQANDTEFACIPEEESPSKRLKPSPKRNASKNIASHGPVIIHEQQCNPVDPAIREKILRQICPSLLTYPGYHDHGARKTDYTSDIKKYIKSLNKGSRNSIERTPPTQPILCFPGANRSYAIKRELGEGGFAPVYLAESVDSPDTFTSDSEADASGSDRGSMFSSRASAKVRVDIHRGSLEAIKVESDTPSAWEFYMIRTVHARLEASIAYRRIQESIVQAHEMHMFKDEGFLVEDYQGQGTLIDLINAVRNEPNTPGITDSGLDEAVVMFFAVELFRIVEGLHACGVLHGDLKPDNCLVRLGDKPSSNVSLMDGAGPSETSYSPTGMHSWGNKGITLIDFGRGIDMHAFPKSVQFVADWKVGSHECVEMRECRPWTYQVDLYGLAGIIYILLFGKYMEVVPASSSTSAENGNGGGLGLGLGGSRKTYRTKESLKRYWERDIWAEVFDLCLNPAGKKWMDMERADENHPMATATEQQSDFGGNNNGAPILPVTNSMRYVREKMERWLVRNAEKKQLHYQLKKLENMISKKR